jgi:predicted Zn-ribbon and HTH transcriptional regulator
MIELQDIINQHGDEFLKNHKLSPEQWKAYAAIKHCRTAVLGAHVDVCGECGYEKISYNSCRNRHCPKCQALAREQWIEKQNQYLLNTGYFHVVFTMPDELNALMLRNQDVAYGLFFKAVSETLLELCADKKYLGAKPGITAVLHTWDDRFGGGVHTKIHAAHPAVRVSQNSALRYSCGKKQIRKNILVQKADDNNIPADRHANHS